VRYILASASERRQELIGRILKKYDILVSDFDEDSVKFTGDCGEYVKAIALGKAKNIADKLSEHCVVIACDTIVYHDKKILGKPKNYEDAVNMLSSLSGNSHKVYSGLAVINTATNDIQTDYECTEVFFSTMSEKEVNDYVRSGEPMDKAGAYGIQGAGGIFVEKIYGCYYNVVGLPLNKLYNLLREMGVNL
jgi:septum formation protein